MFINLKITQESQQVSNHCNDRECECFPVSSKQRSVLCSYLLVWMTALESCLPVANLKKCFSEENLSSSDDGVVGQWSLCRQACRHMSGV